MKDARAFRNGPERGDRIPNLAILEHTLAGNQLGDWSDDVEAIVSERTRTLSATNEVLRRKIEKRERAMQELRAREDEARRVSLAKSELLAGMNHELRSPLCAIIGMLELALRDEGMSGHTREYVELARESGSSLLAMVNHLLDFSRIEGGHLALESVPFSLRETVGESLKPLAFEAGRKQLAFDCEIAAGLGDAIVGDPTRLRQVLTNLVGNAIRFTEHGRVAVRIDLAGSGDDTELCRVSVTDTGVGIARDRQAAIFAPFAQAAPSTSRVYGGSGLGLAISARLVEMMNGSIRVDSEPGRGSVFSFEIPLAQQPAPAVAAMPETTPRLRSAAQTNDRRLDVLLVDDDAINRRVAQAALEQAGHRIRLAEAGAAALRKLRRQRPDVVLMDLRMAKMDGISTTLAIRESERKTGAHVPVIALTASATRDDEQRCLDAGMDGCMTKPIDPDRLLQLLDRIATRVDPAGTIGDEPVLDREALLERVGGDAEILGEITGKFLEEHARLMNAARRAMAKRDAGRFDYAVHTLHGMFRTLGAEAAQAVAGRLESCSLSGEPRRISAGFALLEKAVHALKSELIAFAGAMLKPGPPIPREIQQFAQRGMHEQRHSHR